MNCSANIVQIFVALPFNQAFSYHHPVNKKVELGQIVRVPFGKKTVIGVVTDKQVVSLNEIDYELKDISEILDFPPLNANIIKFIKWVANYNIIPVGNLIKMLLLGEKNLAVKRAKPEKAVSCKAKHEVKLSDIQKKVATEIIKKNLEKFNVHLLHGATGSGKTEVYLDIARKILNHKKQVLILLPEILLTTQLFSRFTEGLKGYSIFQWHSSLTPQKRSIIWQGVLNGEIQVIVSARSGLFLPFKDLGLIIIDEEHDSSFKQEEGVIYNARDMAIVCAQIYNFPIILSSATPSAETYNNANIGKYILHSIESRFTGVELPKIEIVDMAKQNIKQQQWVSEALKKAIKECLSQNNLAMIFLNRRGYTTLTLCGDCGEKFSCPDCEFWLVKHKSLGCMLCHYCGYKQDLLQSCPECSSDKKLISYGPGIEKIYEELRNYFVDARIAVLSSDTVDSIKKASILLESIGRGEYDIILGTQMLAKGLNFPKLQLVGVVDADFGQNGFDMRVMEKTFQLLYQVAGRAGRENNQGLVLMQTYQPDSNLLSHISNWQYDDFIRMELKNREIALMPPFSRLIMLRGNCFNEHLLQSYMKLLMQNSIVQKGITFFGPAPAPMYKIRNKYRWQIILKITKPINIKQYINNWLSQVDKPVAVNLKIDVDPYNFN